MGGCAHQCFSGHPRSSLWTSCACTSPLSLEVVGVTPDGIFAADNLVFAEHLLPGLLHWHLRRKIGAASFAYAVLRETPTFRTILEIDSPLFCAAGV